MATKTTNIEVKVDETLAAAIAPRIALASRLWLTPSGDTTRRSRRGMRPATPTGRSGSMSPSRRSRPSGRRRGGRQQAYDNKFLEVKGTTAVSAADHSGLGA